MQQDEYLIVDGKAKLSGAIWLLRAINKEVVIDIGADDFLRTVHILEKWREDLWKAVNVEEASDE